MDIIQLLYMSNKKFNQQVSTFNKRSLYFLINQPSYVSKCIN